MFPSETFDKVTLGALIIFFFEERKCIYVLWVDGLLEEALVLHPLYEVSPFKSIVWPTLHTHSSFVLNITRNQGDSKLIF